MGRASATSHPSISSIASIVPTRVARASKARQRGLGLAIVKALAEAMGGTVQAANLAGHGAVFIVAIPSLPPENWKDTAPCAHLSESLRESILNVGE